MTKDVDVDMDAVNEYQIKLGLNNLELARKMGISPTLLSRVKHKKRTPATAFIRGLIRAGMPVEKIFKSFIDNSQ